MKKVLSITLLIIMLIASTGFTPNDSESFDVNSLYDYQKEFESEDVGACAYGDTKSYMDYRAVTDPSSTQYWFIKEEMEVDPLTGFLLDKDGFIGVALGSYYGEIGDRYYFTLETGVVLPVVKVDEKADKDTDATGCYHISDGSVIEFVIDAGVANEFYGYYANGLVLQGNFANYSIYDGNIIKAEKVSDVKRKDYVTYVDQPILIPNNNIFEYASGY